MSKDEEKRIPIEELKDFCIGVLMKSGLEKQDAIIAAEVLIVTDTCGTYSHGTKNLYGYINKFKAGGMDPKARPAVINEGSFWALVDGNTALGVLSAYRAMEIAIQKASEFGIGYVGVRNGCHFGAAGYYAGMAAKKDMLGIAMSNADPNMSAPGSKCNVIGNNPFAYAIPTGKENFFFLDIAMSTVAALKVHKAKAEGICAPQGWVVDSEGLPTTDLRSFPEECFLQPMAGHKGYGLAILVETLAAVITGAGILKEVNSWNQKLSSKCETGHAFIALDISKIMPMESFYKRMNQMINEIHDAPKAVNAERIYLPGEIELEKRNDAIKNGIVLPYDVILSLKQLSEEMEIEITF